MPGNNQVKKLAAKVAVKVPHPDSVVEVRVMPPESNFEIKVTPGSEVIELRIQPGSSLIELRITPPEQFESAQKEIIEVKPEETEEKATYTKADSTDKESFPLAEEIKNILEPARKEPNQETKTTEEASAPDLEGADFLMEDRPGPEHAFFGERQEIKAQTEDVDAKEVSEPSSELTKTPELTEETQDMALNECSGDLLEVPAAATNYHTRICPALAEENSQTCEAVSFDELACPSDQSEKKSGHLSPEGVFNADNALANEETSPPEQQESIKAEPEDNAPIDLQCDQPETINCNLMPKNWQPASVEESQLAEDQSITEDSILPEINTIPGESSMIGVEPSLDENGITPEDSEAEGVEQIDIPKEEQIASKSELLEDLNSVTAAEEEQFLEKKVATEPDMPLNELPDTSEQLSKENVMAFSEESITVKENNTDKPDEVNNSETSPLPVGEALGADAEDEEEFHSAELDEAAKAALARLSAAVSDETSFLSSNTVLTTNTVEVQESIVGDNAKIDVTTIIPEASSIAQKAREEAAEKALERMVSQENENTESELESKAHDLPPTPTPVPPIKKEPRRSLHVTPREAVTAVLVEILSDSDPHLVDVDDEPLPEEEQMDLSYIYDDDNADDALDIDTIDVSNLSLDLEKSDIQSISAPTVFRAKPLQKADN